MTEEKETKPIWYIRDGVIKEGKVVRTTRTKVEAVTQTLDEEGEPLHGVSSVSLYGYYSTKQDAEAQYHRLQSIRLSSIDEEIRELREQIKVLQQERANWRKGLRDDWAGATRLGQTHGRESDGVGSGSLVAGC